MHRSLRAGLIIPVVNAAPSSFTEPTDDLDPLPGRRILVVDDNRDTAHSLALLMRMSGENTQTAYDGAQAVELAASFRPDVILLDIGLPRMSGYQACRAIRQQPWGREIVIVAVTAWGQESDRLESKAAGFDEHMVKPVVYETLTEVLAGLWASRRGAG